MTTITKNTKDVINILRWLQTNACTKADGQETLEKINISRGEDTVTLETTNGFSHTKISISGINECPIDLPVAAGLYTMTLLSHQTVEWEEFTSRNFPNVASLYPLSPKFLITEPYTNFSVVCGVDSSRMAKFLPTFIKPIRICLNGAMLGIQGNSTIDDEKHPIEITGLLMPMHFEPDSNEYIFDEQGSKICRQNLLGGWLEILTPVLEAIPVSNSELEPEKEVATPA